MSSYVGIADTYNEILVWERLDNSKRVVKSFAHPRYFFVPSDDGEYLSMDDVRLKKLLFTNKDDYDFAKRIEPISYEADISPLYRVLMDEYYKLPIPQLNYAFFDIEVLVQKGKGFSKPSDPFQPINAITFYKAWLDKYITIAVPPEEWVKSNGFKPFKVNLTQYGYEDVKVDLILVPTEAELLSLLLDELVDIDFISGWNSEFYDMPYIYKRIEKVLGIKATNRLNFRDDIKCRTKMVERFGTEELVIQLQGRSHLDYCDMFKKFTFEGRESFALEAIASEEVDFHKLHHNGLDKLYLYEFEKFIAYNVIDVLLIVLLNRKFKFVELVNQMAHENTVPFADILGTTKYVDTGLCNYAIHELGVRVKNKDIVTDHKKVEGAIVLTPKKGLYKWIGSVDINSLYPSVIRSLNMSPEKVIGYFYTEETIVRLLEQKYIDDIVVKMEKMGGNPLDFLIPMSKETDWKGIKNKDDYLHTLHLQSGESITLTGKEWNKKLRENKWAISAYGIVFDQGNGQGILPSLLEFWYKERKRLQKEKKNATTAKLEATEKQINELIIKLAYDEAQFDLQQHTKKISLNSAYGALLAKGFRWGIKEWLGASTTYCGRAITNFMAGVVIETLTGTFQELIKSYDVAKDTNGIRVQNIYHSPVDELIYADTDSNYFLTTADNKDEAIIIADGIADIVNERFQEFMQEAFLCQPNYDNIIACGREVVAERGLFQARKKYMLKVVNLDGFDCNKMKAMGSEIKKSDTPKVIQKFLKSTVDKVLNGMDYPEISDFVNNERKRLFNEDIDENDKLLFGVAKATNNLDYYTEVYDAEKTRKPITKEGRKVTVPGHIRAAINYNKMVLMCEGIDGMLIANGEKVKVFELLPNDFDFKTIALPAEAEFFPEWLFDYFVIDFKSTEEKLITAKLEGIFEAWGYDVPTPFKTRVNKLLKF